MRDRDAQALTADTQAQAADPTSGLGQSELRGTCLFGCHISRELHGLFSTQPGRQQKCQRPNQWLLKQRREYFECCLGAARPELCCSS